MNDTDERIAAILKGLDQLETIDEILKAEAARVRDVDFHKYITLICLAGDVSLKYFDLVCRLIDIDDAPDAA